MQPSPMNAGPLTAATPPAAPASLPSAAATPAPIAGAVERRLSLPAANQLLFRDGSLTAAGLGGLGLSLGMGLGSQDLVMSGLLDPSALHSMQTLAREWGLGMGLEKQLSKPGQGGAGLPPYSPRPR